MDSSHTCQYFLKFIITNFAQCAPTSQTQAFSIPGILSMLDFTCVGSGIDRKALDDTCIFLLYKALHREGKCKHWKQSYHSLHFSVIYFYCPYVQYFMVERQVHGSVKIKEDKKHSRGSTLLESPNGLTKIREINESNQLLTQ